MNFIKFKVHVSVRSLTLTSQKISLEIYAGTTPRRGLAPRLKYEI